MGRAIGEILSVEQLPEIVVLIFAALTQLADTWFVFGTLALFYWLATDRWARQPRRVGATLIALATSGLAATTFMKILIGAPRPPAAGSPATLPAWLPDPFGTLFGGWTVASGFGFPSGHAVGSVVMYGGFALLLDRWDRQRRLLAAGVIVSLVASSRIVIGVHYLVDVVVGIAVGLAVLLAVLRAAGYPDRLDPTTGFVAAAILSVGALALALYHGYATRALESGMGVGTAAGAVGGWRLCSGDESRLSVPETVVTLLVTGGLWFGTFTLEPPLPVTMVLTFGAAVGILAAPAFAEQARGRTATAGALRER